VPTEYDRKVPFLQKRVLKRGGSKTLSRKAAPKAASTGVAVPRFSYFQSQC
jgi:hypothetical protein